MAVKALTSLVVRARSLEWNVLHKGSEKQAPPSAHQAELDPGENRKTLLEGLETEQERLVGEIRAKCGSLPAPISIGIPASWVLLRIAELPAGSPDELKSMVELQVDKFSPFPVDESAVSYELLQEHEGHCRLLLSAIRTDVINKLADALRASGLQPKWVDVNVLGWWRLLKDAGAVKPTGSQIFVILDDSACDIIVATAGIPVALRSLSGMEDIPPDEVDEEIARETVYTLSSLDLEGPGPQPAEIGIWHRGEPPAGLIARFAAPFSMIATPHSLESLPPLSEGLLRRAESRAEGTLNLAPAAWEAAENARRNRRRIIASTLLVAGLWLGGMAILFGGIQIQKQRLTTLEKELTALKVPSENVRAIRDRAEELRKYMDRSRSGLECLREVSDRLPPGIELASFNYHKNKTLEMSGVADTYAILADFKKDLEKSALFTATELPRTRHVARGEEFKIICTLPGGGTP
ncbi:MAG: pilus assembly protein PilM [bacterium]